MAKKATTLNLPFQPPPENEAEKPLPEDHVQCTFGLIDRQTQSGVNLAQ